MNSKIKIFSTAGIWALGADDLQWVIHRAKQTKNGPVWRPLSYISSTKAVLSERMREAGMEAGSRSLLLEGLPDTFQEWKSRERAS